MVLILAGTMESWMASLKAEMMAAAIVVMLARWMALMMVTAKVDLMATLVVGWTAVKSVAKKVARLVDMMDVITADWLAEQEAGLSAKLMVESRAWAMLCRWSGGRHTCCRLQRWLDQSSHDGTVDDQ